MLSNDIISYSDFCEVLESTVKDPKKLFTYIIDNSHEYEKMSKAIVDEMKRKIEADRYNKTQSIKSFLSVVDKAARNLAKDEKREAQWNIIYPKDLRKEVALELEKFYRADL